MIQASRLIAKLGQAFRCPAGMPRAITAERYVRDNMISSFSPFLSSRFRL